MEKRLKELDDYLDSMEKRCFFRGAVLLEKGGKVLLQKGYGEDAQASFQIASVTKQFTAAGVLLLDEAGVLSIDETINTYLGKLGSERWEKVTVHQLLNHTSGIPNYTNWEDYLRIAPKIDVEKIMKRARKEKLLFAPGTDFDYSNTGYQLLGLIIEAVTGKSYGAFIEERLLRPAKMTHAGVRSTTSLPKGVVEGYCLDPRQERLIPDHSEAVSACYSDGSIYASTSDLLKWSHVLDGGDFLSNNIIARMTNQGKEGYGYGLIVGKSFGRKTIFHSGKMAGYNSDFCKYPNDQCTIIVLGNNLNYNAAHITATLSKWLFTDEEIPRAIPFPPDFDFAFCDTYRSKNGDPIDFFLEDGHLFIDGPQPTECVLLSNNCLYSPSDGVEFEMQRDGRIVVYDAFGEEVDTLV